VGYQHYTAFSEGAVYPPSYGQGCSAHDMHLLPYCVPQWCGDPINDECVPRWCAEQWCWVDEASCSGVPSPMPTSYFAPLRLTYSYEACNATNVFSAFYEGKTAPRPPPPPPYTPPRLPPSPPSRTYDVEWAIGSAATAALLLAFASVCYQLYRIIRSQQQEKRAAAREQAMAAIETTRQMRFAACFIRASDFLKLGKLVNHEQVRNGGRLVFRDSFNELALGDDYTIFISHQWTSFSAPDPSGEHYAVMCAAVRKIAGDKVSSSSSSGGRAEAADSSGKLEYMLDRIFIWVDFISIPQCNAETTKLAIHSLSAYASLASEFVIVAPRMEHHDTGAPIDFNTYRRRCWCRAEQVCHILRNGLDGMWLARSATDIQKLSSTRTAETLAAPLDEASMSYLSGSFKSKRKDDWMTFTEEEWLIESMRVFQGEVTQDMDKLALMLPILGLYAELYAVAEAMDVPFFANVLQLLRESRDEILPRTFRPKASPSSFSKRPKARLTTAQKERQTVLLGASAAHSQLAVQAVHGTADCVELELFGSLVETVEELVDEDAALRDRLRDSVLRRRGLLEKKRRELTRVDTKRITQMNASRISQMNARARWRKASRLFGFHLPLQGTPLRGSFGSFGRSSVFGSPTAPSLGSMRALEVPNCPAASSQSSRMSV